MILAHIVREAAGWESIPGDTKSIFPMAIIALVQQNFSSRQRILPLKGDDSTEI